MKLGDLAVPEGVQDEPILATLIHLSDLHFGSKFTTDETLIKKALAFFPFVKNVAPHSYQAARALAIRVRQILDDRHQHQIPTCVVVTGDLTCSGDPDEFDLVQKFLCATCEMHGHGVGLSLGPKFRKNIRRDPGLFTIPGNHDIFQRNNPKAMGVYHEIFRHTYPMHARIETKGRPVDLYGLDSTQNTEMGHNLARGAVPDRHLDRLTEKIKQQKGNPIKVVCLHHPLADSPFADNRNFEATMRLDGREMVAAHLTDCKVNLVLSGHVHEPYTLGSSIHRPNHSVAGTATQQFAERSFAVIDIHEKGAVITTFNHGSSRSQFDVVARAWVHF